MCEWGGGLSASIDWVTAVLPEAGALPWELVPGSEEWGWAEQKGGGVNGYRREWRCGSLRFFTEGAVEGMGVMLLLSGDGCRELEARMAALALPDERQSSCSKVGSPLASAAPFDWQGWFAYLLARGAHLTRLDVAWDVRDGSFTVEGIAEALDRGHLTRESVNNPETYGSIVPGQGRRLETIYLGSKKSDTRVTFYDKAVERAARGVVVEGPWVRVELRELRERAQAAMALFVGGGLRPIVGVLRRAICFREVCDDKNRSRWPVALWWQKFLDGAESLSLRVAPRMKTLEDKYRWLVEQVAPTLALVFRWKGPVQLQELVGIGQKRLSPAQLALLGGGGRGSLALRSIYP